MQEPIKNGGLLPEIEVISRNV